MAKSLYQINLDYNKALQQAAELEAIARELKNLGDSEFHSCLEQVAANWKGDNAQAYIKKGQRLKTQMLTSATELNNAAKTIRSIAKRTRQADRNAYFIALSSGN